MNSILKLSLLSLGLVLIYYSISKQWMTSIIPSLIHRKRDLMSLACPAASKKNDVDKDNHIALEDFSFVLKNNNGMKLQTNQNIYFIESSCGTTVRPRTLCSFESFAFHNPDYDVRPLFLTNFLEDEFRIMRKLKHTYKNLKFMSFNISDLITDSPIEAFFQNENWFVNEAWRSVLLSDLLRPVTLWQLGGIYSDTDVICLKNLSTLGKNCLGFQRQGVVNSAFFKFQRKHPFLYSLIQHIALNFDAFIWGKVGPLAVTATLTEFCKVDEVDELRKVTCRGNISVMDEKAFYPIPWQQGQTIFKALYNQEHEKRLSNSFALHTWNHETGKYNSTIGSNTIFDVEAKRHCPLTYHSLIEQKITSF